MTHTHDMQEEITLYYYT